jgi:hypothetical protein
LRISKSRNAAENVRAKNKDSGEEVFGGEARAPRVRVQRRGEGPGMAQGDVRIEEDEREVERAARSFFVAVRRMARWEGSKG